MLTDEELFLTEFENDINFRNSVMDDWDLSEEQKESINNFYDNSDNSEVQEEIVYYNSASSYDYSSILLEMNTNILNLSSSVGVLSDEMNNTLKVQNGLLNNSWYQVYFLFGFFVFGALVLVIKFLKQFF